MINTLSFERNPATQAKRAQVLALAREALTFVADEQLRQLWSDKIEASVPWQTPALAFDLRMQCEEAFIALKRGYTRTEELALDVIKEVFNPHASEALMHAPQWLSFLRQQAS